MSSAGDDRLRRAAAYLDAGQPHLARPLLIEVVKQEPHSEQAWLLLSQAVAEQPQKIDCLQRALRINPASREAQMRLQQLLSPPEERPASLETPLAPPPLAPSTALPSEQNPARAPEAASPVQSDNDALRRAAAVPRPAARPRYKRSQWIIIGAMGCLALASIAVALALLFTPGAARTDQAAAPAAAIAAATATPTPTLTVLPSPTLTQYPATWTPTPTPAATATRTATPFPTLNPTLLGQMDMIEEQVADLRGLTNNGSVPRVLIRREAVEQTLRRMLIDQGYAGTLADQARTLSALGLIKPTYDLFKYAMNGLADNVGGFYIPWLKQLFVIGTRFGGIERFVFSHEFEHALADQHFHLDALGVYPTCVTDQQRCAAIRALVEGDATLLMQQWWQQYAGPQDYQDILRYHPPRQTLPDDYPPPYVSRDLEFPYLEGFQFVQYLHKRGNWAGVNQAYQNLPASTEQILHPEKYVAGERPMEVAAPPLTDTLGAGWRLIDDDVLGEWTTYLILDAGADLAAQLNNDEALKASRGWGGDRYQVYYSDALSQTVLAAEWVWDTPRDATEYKSALTKYLNERYRGARSDRAAGDCWEANQQASCVFLKENKVLWLLAPDTRMLEKVTTQYSDFP